MTEGPGSEEPVEQPAVRAATEGDIPLLLELFAELAAYERLDGELKATEEQLCEALFGPRPRAEALIAEHAGEVAGYAVFFPTFSSFLARSGMWLEDLYVRPAHRGGGVGRALLRVVAARTVQAGGGRLEWCALDWNELALGFYSHLGAERLGEWIPHRVTGEILAALAQESAPLRVAQRR